MNLVLLKGDEIVDFASKDYVTGPEQLCDSIVLKAPPGSYMLRVSYGSASYKFRCATMGELVLRILSGLLRFTISFIMWFLAPRLLIEVLYLVMG